MKRIIIAATALVVVVGCAEEETELSLVDIANIICNDKKTSPFESGADCGGGCAPCPNGSHCENDSDCQSLFCRKIADSGICFGPDTDRCTSVEDDYERKLVCDKLQGIVVFCGKDGIDTLPEMTCVQPQDPLFYADDFGGAKYFCCGGLFQ